MHTYTITTPIYYINDLPHLGTAYTTVISDVLARYQRSRGREVFFLTGTDENGEKTLRAAEQRQVAPAEYVAALSQAYKDAWAGLNISFDRFIRTTDADHVQAVTAVFQALRERGDIYKGSYEGWYCVADETFFMEVADEKCPECGRTVERVTQEAYFFALSRYNEPLRKLYQERPDFVVPRFRCNEVIRFIEAGLRDICITRQVQGWGIPVPGDPEHVVYVWFDALINYITACGYPSDQERMERTWPAALHVVGKDILVRFHATLWPAMLMGLGLPLPEQILAHGYLLVEGEKMSKSRMAEQLQRWRDDPARGFSVPSLRPDELVRSLQEQAGIQEDHRSIAVDALRYLLIRDMPPGEDAEFDPERLAARYNAELANDFGNLLNRTLSMLQRYRDGVIPQAAGGPLQETAAAAVEGAAEAYDSLRPADALGHAMELIRAGNRYIQERKPWDLVKAGDQDAVGEVLYSCGEACRISAIILAPALPSASAEALRQLGLRGAGHEMQWARTAWGGWPAGDQTLSPEPIFPRIESRKPAPAAQPAVRPGPVNTPGPAHTAEPAAAPPVAADEITIDEFARVKLRIATIRSAERVEGAKKLLRLILDLGDHERQIVSGIAEQYEPSSLVGRQIAVIVNLKPATIRGVQSFGMLLAADLEGKAVLLQPDSPVPAGSPVK